MLTSTWMPPGPGSCLRDSSKVGLSLGIHTQGQGDSRWVGGWGEGQAELEDKEREGSLECTCTHPHPSASLRGGPQPHTKERGQTAVLSLASGRPVLHNDPFIRLREPWAGVSSDKGGRQPLVPLGGELSPIPAGTQDCAKWRSPGSLLELLHLPGRWRG